MFNPTKVYNVLRDLFASQGDPEGVEELIASIRPLVEACPDGQWPIVHCYLDQAQVEYSDVHPMNFAVIHDEPAPLTPIDEMADEDLDRLINEMLDEAGVPQLEDPDAATPEEVIGGRSTIESIAVSARKAKK